MLRVIVLWAEGIFGDSNPQLDSTKRKASSMKPPSWILCTTNRLNMSSTIITSFLTPMPVTKDRPSRKSVMRSGTTNFLTLWVHCPPHATWVPKDSNHQTPPQPIPHPKTGLVGVAHFLLSLRSKPMGSGYFDSLYYWGGDNQKKTFWFDNPSQENHDCRF